MGFGQGGHGFGQCAGGGLGQGSLGRCGQAVAVEHAAVAPHRNVGLAGLGLGREQKVGKHLGGGGCAGVDRNGHKVDVADGAAREAKAVNAGRQLLAGNEVGRLVGVEGERQAQLAIGQHAVHVGGAGRKGFAAAPLQRVQLIQVGPQRRGGGGEGGGVDRLLQGGGGGREFAQQLLQKGGAVEIGRAGVAQAARVGLGHGQPLLGVARRHGQGAFVGHEGELGRAPGGFVALGGHRKVAAHGLGQVHQRPVGQGLGPGAVQQLGGFEGAEVLAVDPHQVHRAVVAPPGGHLGLDAFDHLGGIAHLDVLHLKTVAGLGLFGGPGDVGVDGLAPAPGVEIHRLPPRLGLQPGPGGGRGRGGSCAGGTGRSLGALGMGHRHQHGHQHRGQGKSGGRSHQPGRKHTSLHSVVSRQKTDFNQIASSSHTGGPRQQSQAMHGQPAAHSRAITAARPPGPRLRRACGP